MMHLFLLFEVCPHWFPVVCNHTNSEWQFPFPQISSICCQALLLLLSLLVFVMLIGVRWYLQVVSIDLYFPNSWGWWTFFAILLSDFYFFFWELSAQVPGPFFESIIGFLILWILSIFQVLILCQRYSGRFSPFL